MALLLLCLPLPYISLRQESPCIEDGEPADTGNQIYESHAIPHLYAATTRYSRRGCKAISQFLAAPPVLFEEAYKAFRQFFKKKTGFAWEDRLDPRINPALMPNLPSLPTTLTTVKGTAGNGNGDGNDEGSGSGSNDGISTVLTAKKIVGYIPEWDDETAIRMGLPRNPNIGIGDVELLETTNPGFFRYVPPVPGRPRGRMAPGYVDPADLLVSS